MDGMKQKNIEKLFINSNMSLFFGWRWIVLNALLPNYEPGGREFESFRARHKKRVRYIHLTRFFIVTDRCMNRDRTNWPIRNLPFSLDEVSVLDRQNLIEYAVQNLSW